MAYQTESSLAELVSFVRVAEHGGFSAAARSEGLRKATLVERLQALEARLGAVLLARSTRSVRLTDEGKAYLEHARRALGAARDADACVAAARAAPSGTLRVTASPPLAGLLVKSVIPRYLLACPEVTLELDSSTRTVNLAREPFDVALRVGKLSDSTLRSRRLGAVVGGYYASPHYLARRGTPKHPSDLAEHDAIVIPRGDTAPVWHFVDGRRKRPIVVTPRLSLGSFELALSAALAGLGIMPAPAISVEADLASRNLVPVLASFAPPGFEVHAVYSAAGSRSPKLRAFLELLGDLLAKPKAPKSNRGPPASCNARPGTASAPA